MTTVQQLVARRALLRRTKRGPRKMQVQLLPRTGLVQYLRVLTDVGATMDHAILDVLRDAGVVRTDVALPAPVLARIERELASVVGSRALIARIVRVAESVSDHTGSELRRQLRTSVGVNLVAEPDLARIVDRFRSENLKLVKSLSEDKLARVKDVLEDAPVGQRHEVIARALREQAGVTQSRAALIATDQVLKLAGSLTQARHEAAGITEFRWSTSRDERVRPSHRELEGRVFRYAEPPTVDGERTLPSQAVRCRCVAVPILPT